MEIARRWLELRQSTTRALNAAFSHQAGVPAPAAVAAIAVHIGAVAPAIAERRDAFAGTGDARKRSGAGLATKAAIVLVGQQIDALVAIAWAQPRRALYCASRIDTRLRRHTLVSTTAAIGRIRQRVDTSPAADDPPRLIAGDAHTADALRCDTAIDPAGPAVFDVRLLVDALISAWGGSRSAEAARADALAVRGTRVATAAAVLAIGQFIDAGSIAIDPARRIAAARAALAQRPGWASCTAGTAIGGVAFQAHAEPGAFRERAARLSAAPVRADLASGACLSARAAVRRIRRDVRAHAIAKGGLYAE